MCLLILLFLFVFEPSLGVERAFLVFMFDAYIKDNKDNIILKLNPKLAPIKAAILPLVKKDNTLTKTAKEIHSKLKTEWNTTYDETGSVGRRYARNDEIGTPYCITVDPQTEKDKKVTIRNRDNGEQKRIKITELKDTLRKLINQEIQFEKIINIKHNNSYISEITYIKTMANKTTPITLTDDRINLNKETIIGFDGKTYDGEHHSESTINLKSLEIQTLDVTVGETYKIIANAILHKADLAAICPVIPDDIERKRGILYNGSIAIYGPKVFMKKGVVAEDYGLLVNGRIWLARPEQENQLTLKEIILGTKPRPQRIKKIIKEYESQDKAKRERAEHNRHFSHGAGRELQKYTDGWRNRD